MFINIFKLIATKTLNESFKTLSKIRAHIMITLTLI